MKVVEIFDSIEGEGIRVGLPATFIRLYGCNLKCSYCDSEYACVGDNYAELDIDTILSLVNNLGHKYVTLTGGEPLIHPGATTLIHRLISAGYKVNIETNGAVDLAGAMDTNTIITLDYKCPSSGMEHYMKLGNLSLLRSKDVLKFVVGSQEDLDKAYDIINTFKLEGKCNIFISPVFGKIEPKQIVESLLRTGLQEVRVQLQIHKFIWDPNMKGV